MAGPLMDGSGARRSAEERAQALDHRAKWALLVVNLATIFALAVVALQENVFSDWRRIRAEYAEILEERATDELGEGIARQFEIEIAQYVLPDLDRVDRCVTCHAGVDDPRMADLQQPFRTHPGSYLQIHDPNTFGCTVCHDGQGRATEVADAHGAVVDWEHPLLRNEHIEASCARCHPEGQAYGPDGLVARADPEGARDVGVQLISQGRRLVDQKGCLGCHAVRGKGGNIGPDLTEVGDKTHHEFSFAHVELEGLRRVETWLEQHFLDPEEVSPGTLMPDQDLSESEAGALTAYMLSLKEPAPADFHMALDEESVPPDGGQLYDRYCSACHNRDGSASTNADINSPSLGNTDALAVTSDDYYRLIIASGRSGTKMPAWGPGDGNLEHGEIDAIVRYIRGWEASGADPSAASAEQGDAATGRVYYEGLCASCHGFDGEGGIGNALSSLSFLAAVSDRFLAESIIEGRPGTAMPNWKELPAQAVSDILAYIRTWQPDPPTYSEVRRVLDRTSRSSLRRVGRQLYSGRCASCHGRRGEGRLGPRLSTPDLLQFVDDRFLHRAITEGRPSTGMPAWRHLSADDVAALIAHIRSWDEGGPRAVPASPPPGDYAVGRLHYRESCAGCHGERGEGSVGSQLTNPVLLDSASDDLLYQWIAHGREGTAMKGFLEEEQGLTSLDARAIADVIAYLRHEGEQPDRPLRKVGAGYAAFGAKLYAESCASCHGVEGEGASGPQLNNPSFLRVASDGFLEATIVLGRTGTAMRSMVHGGEGLGQLHPEEIADVVAFIRAWEYPPKWRKPRPVAEMSPRAIASGREGYDLYCKSCHGPTGLGELDGEGYFAPALNNPEFLAAASDGFLQATIARGRKGTPMRPFGRGSGGIVSLDSETIADIVSFIRTWQEPPVSERGNES